MPDGGGLVIQIPEKAEPLYHPHRYKVIVGGRGKGASWSIARVLIGRAYGRPLRVLCAREVQRTIADSVHQLLQDQITALGLSAAFRVTESDIHGPHGSRFAFTGLRQLTAENIRSYEGFDIAWVAEARNISKKSWSTLIPTIRKDGSEIWLDLNPELDSDETYDRFVVHTPPDTALMFMSWKDNPWFPETLKKERQTLYDRCVESGNMDDYENVWEGKCRSAVEGAIYAGEIRDALEQKRVRPLPYDPLLKVHTVWDLGWNDRMSIGFFQRLHSELRCIEFLEDQFKTYDWYAEEIKRKRYNLGKAFLPHDGKHRNAQTGLSAEEILRKLGLDADASQAPASIEEGIKATRLTFRQMFFDEVKCKALVDHLRRYRRSIPTTTNEPQSPLHDEHSHAADMLREAVRRLPDMRNDEKMKPLVYPPTGIK
jgi:phage terminase large subunit